jgi:hypothetical protein
MRVRVLAVVAVIGLSGCQPSTEQASAPSASGSPAASVAPADAAADLAAAAAKLGSDTVRVRFNLEGQMSLRGVVDPRAQNAQLSMDMGAVDDNSRAEIRKVGDDVWVRLTGPVAELAGTGGKWLHLDAASMTPASSLAVIPGDDPAGALAMVKAITEAHRTAPDAYAGTIDLTRTPKYSRQTLAALGAKAAAVPFTARTDAQGRLIELSTDLSAVASGAGKAVTRFSDFGVAVDVLVPDAAETTELPPELRSVINA